MIFRPLFDPETSTYSYLLGCEASGEAVLIDPVLEQLERDARLLSELGLRLRLTLETHVHADHVTAAGRLRELLGSRVGVGARAGVRGADCALGQGDELRAGALRLEVRETPGHTAGCVTYVCPEARMAFTGDALLVRGCGRTDFQGGSAETLFRSVHDQIFTLPGATLLYPGHDYQGRTVTTVAEERRWNPRLGGAQTLEGFRALMAGLALPRPSRMDTAVPANLAAGHPGEARRPPARSGACRERVPGDALPGPAPAAAPEGPAAAGPSGARRT